MLEENERRSLAGLEEAGVLVDHEVLALRVSTRALFLRVLDRRGYADHIS